MSYAPRATPRDDRYKVSVEQYVSYQRDGYLKVQGLVAAEDTQRLFDWANDVLYGREPIQGLDAAQESSSLEDLLKRFTRVHMLHRTSATAEWGLLHPRVLDVLEALIGPDVLALQSMLFYNPPGRGGQGWHQDAYYINTYPDTLIGAWICLEPADEENGCLWVVPGSQNEPIYPPHGAGQLMHAEGVFDDLVEVENASHLDDEVNTLSKVTKKYPPPISVPMEPGDVLFFHSHLLHRSYSNRSASRFRRAYVTHFCNARSWVPWNHGNGFHGCANEFHILARGWTHLPFATPLYGTAVHISQPVEGEGGGQMMMGMEDGSMMAISVHAETPVG
jgi:phytanoyl-CoA hydroxylase